MRNPSKNTIKRLVKREILESQTFKSENWIFEHFGFVKYHKVYERIEKVSKGKIKISGLKGCKRYGYNPNKFNGLLPYIIALSNRIITQTMGEKELNKYFEI